MTRRTFLLISASLTFLIVAQTAYWKVMVDQVRTGYRDWIAAQAAGGWDVTSGEPEIGGWPLTAAITVPALTLRHTGPGTPANVDVAAPGLTMSISLFDRNNLRLNLVGSAHVHIVDLRDVIVNGDQVVMSMPLRRVGAPSINLHAQEMRIEPTGGAGSLTFSALSAQIRMVETATLIRSQPAAVFTATSEAVALPPGLKWPLGRNISSLAVDGQLFGPFPDRTGIAQSAAAWRDGGGVLKISHLAMEWGPLGLTCSAILGLDDHLQPVGSGNARIVGFNKTLDQLAAGGTLARSAAAVAKAVLSLMAATGDTDRPSLVHVPLTLQYRTLSLRQLPLLRLPELDWPARKWYK